MDILRTSPHLEYVELDNIPNLSLPETCNPESSTQLDAVKAIALSGLGPEATSFLLSAIRVPKCCSLRINCDLGSGSPVQMLLTPDLTHLHCAIQNMARLANSIEIDRYSSRRHVFTVGDFKLILEAEEEDKLREAFHWLAHALGTVGLTLNVRLALDDHGPESFYLEPQFFSGITELELFGSSRRSILPHWVLAKLRQPLEMNPPQWTLQHLRVIDFRLGLEYMEEVVEMLGARYTHVDAVDGRILRGQTKGMQRPSPLAEIHFWYIPGSAEEDDQQKRWFLQVHQAVPTTKIFWGGELQRFDEDH